MREVWNAHRIFRWAQGRFGKPDLLTTANRMKKEIDEFYEALEAGDLEEARGEIVDIEIMLRQCAVHLEVCLHQGVDTKMAINNRRDWEKGPDGDYQHVD